MIAAYDGVFEAVSRSLSTLGMTLVRNDDYIARFSAPDGRAVDLLGDRYAAPGFQIAMVAGTHGRPHGEGLAIDILMEALASEILEDHRHPSLENQLWFLQTFESVLFSIEPGDAIHRAYEAINVDLSCLD